jgi:hypothetical protein
MEHQTGGRSSMNESGLPRRPGPCPRCRGRTRVVDNPFFGVGLAVHSHLVSCTRCQFIGFLAIQNAAHLPTAREATPIASRPRLRAGLARMIRLGRR